MHGKQLFTVTGHKRRPPPSHRRLIPASARLMRLGILTINRRRNKRGAPHYHDKRESHLSFSNPAVRYPKRRPRVPGNKCEAKTWYRFASVSADRYQTLAGADLDGGN